MSLEVVGVTRRFGARVVLDNVSFRIEPGEAVALVGPSGTGKSTLLNLIGSLDQPDSGSIRAFGRELSRLSLSEQEDYRNHTVGFLFQEHHLLPQLSALENVLVPTLGCKPAPAPPSPRTLSWGGGLVGRGKQLLDHFGLADRADQFPPTLSGGERQRVALARALINDPPLLLGDEPTGALDRAGGDQLIDALLELARSGKIVIVVTHNVDHAKRFDRILTLADGRLG